MKNRTINIVLSKAKTTFANIIGFEVFVVFTTEMLSANETKDTKTEMIGIKNNEEIKIAFPMPFDAMEIPKNITLAMVQRIDKINAMRFIIFKPLYEFFGLFIVQDDSSIDFPVV